MTNCAALLIFHINSKKEEIKIMATGILWFVSGIVTSMVAGVSSWLLCLIGNNQRQKKQICGLMHDKGMLTMRVSILEDSVRAK